MLNAPLKLEELSLAVSQMANNKAPGIDGLLSETYKQYGEILLPGLLEVLNDSFKTGHRGRLWWWCCLSQVRTLCSQTPTDPYRC